MKILQLGKFYPIRGGVEKVMWDLTRGLSAAGYACDMLCASYDGEKKKQVISLEDHGRCIVVPTWFQVSGTMIAPAMITWLRRHGEEYDIIHVHHPDPMACLALRLSGYKGRVILHWHSDILKHKAILAAYRPLQSWLIRRAEKIVGTTPVYVAQSPALQKVQDKVTWVPIGIDPVQPDPEGAARIQAQYPGRKIVYSLGRLVPYKGYTYLIQAAKYLPDDYLVLIGGTGPLRESLQQEIVSQGLEDKVKLLGFIDDNQLAPLYGAARVFVMSSVMKTEAFGIVQIEAMSTGTPVVATRIPQSGVSWVNEDGVSGLNVEPGDSKALADAIRNLCTLAKNRFETVFRHEKMIEKIQVLYEGNLY